MSRNTHALGAAIAAGIVLFATACGGSSESPGAQADQPTATATPSPTPTEIPCIVGTWRFERASWQAYGDWWDETEDVKVEASDELDELIVDADGTYSEEIAATLTAADSPGRMLAILGEAEGTYTFTAATITLTASRSTIEVHSFENGQVLKVGQFRSDSTAATYNCEGDELRLNRDSGRWVTYFSRA